MTQKKQEDILEPQVGQAETLTPQKKREVKKVIQLIIDAGRSSIKYQAFTDSETVTPVMKVESLVCSVSSTPFGESGAFSMSRSKGEDGKEVVEHWVVGKSARLQGKEYIAMTDGENHKITYFPILCLGALASLPNLYELSTGTSPKRRSLHINLSTLSLAEPMELKKAIEQCKWITVDGVKYRLSFQRSGFLGFPEGYGASLWAKSQLTTEDKYFSVFDIGFGTATDSDYDNLGNLPKRIAATLNGGGGVSALIEDFSLTVSQADSSKRIRPSKLREILETATISDDGKVSALAPDGKDIGKQLEAAIHLWMKDSPLAYAISDLGIKGRRNKIALCGGGFAIPPVQQIVKQRLLKAGIPENHLLIPDNPGTVALSEMKKLYVGENNDAQQAA
ncbi:MAG: hypothetical protein NHB32_06180 [Fischerella sp. CENA71]|nr:hypothetical protein [Fischerella sp. CENA71]